MLERIQVHLNSFIKYSKLIEQFAPIVEDLKKTNSSEFQFHLHIQKMRQIKASLLKQHEEGIVDCIVKRALVSLRSPAAADAFIKKYLKGVNDKDSEEVEKQAELRKVMKPFIDKFLKHQRQGKDYQSDINNIKKKKLELIQKYDAHYIDKVVTDLFRERKYWSSSIFIEKHLKSINGDMLVFDHLISIVQSF
jgi:hypothetical protein